VAETLLLATGRGDADALRFAERHASGVRVWAIEGAGHYGAFRLQPGQKFAVASATDLR
jgi:hypothetical protein